MRKIFALAVVGIVTAACDRSPTAVSAAESHPRTDTGVFGGSGNVVGAPPTYTTSATATEVAVADSGTGRSGVFGGSGN